MRTTLRRTILATAASLAVASGTALASSHMDAPLITLDDAANTTDVYAFLSNSGGGDNLTVALAVYPFEEPGIGPNNFRFDDEVLYEVHVALDDDVDAGRATITYQFRFETQFKNRSTTLQAFLGNITCAPGALDADGFDPNQNLRQTYTVTKVDRRNGQSSDDDDDDGGNGDGTDLGIGRVPPNNQGLVTAEYNTNGGDGPAKPGVDNEDDLDDCTRFGIVELEDGLRAFAGQRDDGFYADIQSIFDLDFTFGGDDGGPNKPFDSQGGFNVHTIVLDIPLSELHGAERAGVYATTSRRERVRLREGNAFQRRGDRTNGRFVQVGRQGNPLFNEALVPVEFKDLYNRTDPTTDDALFGDFARNPELGSNDVSTVFIPDLIKVDLTTGPARLPGDDGFDPLGSIAGGEDFLTNGNGEQVTGGFPNGRRFGDDVLDIAFLALDLRNPANPGEVARDAVDANDITFNRVFPYAATPQNGRSHPHH
ncbi:MAG: DUF4331 domain-containing protein [Alphaproteobacteria bacterium]|nr:DUF4331 domain-containing protein [Alphaproteobacteria bacterium]